MQPTGDSLVAAINERSLPIDDSHSDLGSTAKPNRPGAPELRATIVGTRLTLHDWFPGLVCGGPFRDRFRDRRDAGVAIADLRRWRNDDGSGELSVEFLSGGDRPRAERALERWAHLAGYSRVWLPDRVVEFPAASAPAVARANSSCPTCGAEWDDEIPEFWQTVRNSGCFPRTCLLCGGELPQWSLVDADNPAATRMPTSAVGVPS
jgi:hypothetical protein